MFDYFFSISLESYNTFLIYWGVFGVISGFSIFITKKLPISSRVENKEFEFLGTIDKRLGWIIMEIPILLIVFVVYCMGNNPVNISAVILSLFIIHYINRALIYPYRIKTEGKKMYISMMLTSMIFYVVNGYLIAYYFGSLRAYSIEWLSDPRFIFGTILFFTGFIINITSDNILINLRKPGETGYKIPQGGLFKYVSCPNYFGEILEWVGFAILSWSSIGAVYAIWVGAPLFAQAIQAHRWYKEKFREEYPAGRKAIIPGII